MSRGRTCERAGNGTRICTHQQGDALSVSASHSPNPRRAAPPTLAAGVVVVEEEDAMLLWQGTRSPCSVKLGVGDEDAFSAASVTANGSGRV